MKHRITAKFILTVVSCSILAGVNLSAQAMDLVEVYQLAKQSDPEYLASGFQHQAAGESLEQAWSRYKPTLSFDASRTETTQDIKRSFNSVLNQGKADYPTTQYTLTLSQPIFEWGSVIGIRQAEAQVQQADAEYISAEQNMMLRVVELYFAVLASQDQLAFSQAEQHAIGRQLELVTIQKRNGKVRRTDLLDAQARFATAEAERVNAEYAVKDAQQALRESIGRDVVDLAGLKQTIDLVSPEPQVAEQWVDMAMKQNPALVAQRHKVEAVRQEKERQYAGHYPTLNLVAKTDRTDQEGSLYGGGSEIEQTDIMLRFNLPLYQGGYTSSRTREAAKLFMKSKQELEQISRNTMRQAQSAYFGVVSAIARVMALKKSVDAQSLTLDSKRRGYRSGLYTNLAVLDAERDLYMAKKDYAQARHDYLLNLLRLKHATGQLTEEDLKLTNSWLQ